MRSACKVTVVELSDGLMPGTDRDLVRPLQKRIEKRYETILLKTKVAKLESHARRACGPLSKGPTRRSRSSSTGCWSPWGVRPTAMPSMPPPPASR